MNLRIEDVKVGDKYKLITPALKDYVLDSVYEVEHVSGGHIKFKDIQIALHFENLVYFTKLEQSQYAFYDLVNMSSKAVKDGLFKLIKTDFKSVIALFDSYDFDAEPPLVFHNGEHNHVNCEYIQSLYKETFVIECEEDIGRIKKGAEITLANNLEVKVFAAPLRHSEGWKISCADGKQSGILDIFALKGATVEQERGCNE